LRGKVESEGRSLEIAPVEPGHALQSLVIQLPNKSNVDVGSDGRLPANDVEDALGKTPIAARGPTDCRSGSARNMSRPAKPEKPPAIMRWLIVGRAADCSAAALFDWPG
jgi:hypothetical protein